MFDAVNDLGRDGVIDIAPLFCVIYYMYIIYVWGWNNLMRVLVDIPDKQIEALGTICEAKHLSRAEAVRRAITAFIECNQLMPEQAFGLWSGHVEASLDYQERMRAEW